jgi:translation elongation factor EF-G
VSVFVSKFVAVPAKEVRGCLPPRQQLSNNKKETQCFGAGLLGPIWKPPRFDDDSRAGDEEGKVKQGEIEGGVDQEDAEQVKEEDDEEEEEDAEVLVGFARVFSGTLRADDFNDADDGDDDDDDEVEDEEEEKEADEEEVEEDGDQEEVSNDASLLFLLGPKHDPSSLELTTEACRAAAMEVEGGDGAVRLAAGQMRQTKNQIQNHAGGDCVALAREGALVLAGKVPFALPNAHTSTSGDDSSNNVLTTTAGAKKAKMTKKKKKKETKVAKERTKRRSPIALFLMMGDSLVPVPSVPAGSICAIAGLDRFSSSSSSTSSSSSSTGIVASFY